MSIFLSILGIVIIFSILVIAHEYGHYKTAKRNGVRVLEFGIGFPPKLFSRRKNGTEYSINALPIGGFVRLYGEDGVAKGKGSFEIASFWSKTKIIMAGVTVNFAIAYVLFTFLLATGMPPIGQSLPSFGPLEPQTVKSSGVTVFSVAPNSAATNAGLTRSDVIVSINGVTLQSNDELRNITEQNQGKSVNIVYKRGGENIQKTIVLGSNKDAGYLGVNAQKVQLQNYPWWQAPIAALVLMVQLVIATLAAFGDLFVNLFTQGKVGEQVAGPIGAVSVFSVIREFGFRFVILFAASISLSLAVINALPLPALDGGRQLMLVLRKMGLRITSERENLIHVLGFVALIGLMIVISVFDIIKLRG